MTSKDAPARKVSAGSIHSAEVAEGSEWEGQGAAKVRHDRIERWFTSPIFIGWIAILSLIAGIASLVPLYISIFTHREPNTVIFVLSVCFTLIVVLSIWTISELRRNARLNADVSRQLEVEGEQIRERHVVERRLQSQIELQSELLLSRSSKEQFVADVFRDMARARALHSSDLYGIQNHILEQPGVGRDSFRLSWDRQRDFLNDYCTFVSRLFTGMKGKQCCANIKVIWDLSAHDSLDDVLHTQFGTDPAQTPVGQTTYKTVARCHISRNDGRLMGEQDQSDQRALKDNIIFRRLYDRRFRYFLSNDIGEDIEIWRSDVEAGRSRPFVFPDHETKNFYSRIIGVPILIEGERTGQDGVSLHKFAQLLGFLSVDSLDNSVEFDKMFDVAIASQLSFDIASTFYEYFRCIRHLEFRLERERGAQ